jgi:uncharacterized protein (DUF58 family)
VRRRVDGEWWAVAAGVGLAAAGWAVHATMLAAAGALVAVTAGVLWVWQHECLTGVTYRRTLGQQRATFGESVSVDIELVNDKLLPLTWLHVEDEMPAVLTIQGGTVLPSSSGWRSELHMVVPMLPFQRLRRRLTVVCDHRGEHHFGPAELRSGNPVGYHEHVARVRGQVSLLVYPKVFRLAPPEIASRVPLGDHRARRSLAVDPNRVLGVRDYQPGDPLRHVDWRATARSTGLLVRVFEPANALRVAVFADLRVPSRQRPRVSTDLVEFTVAVTASLVSDLAGRGVATGLYSAGTVGGHPVARPPSRAPTALTSMLELLARISPYGQVSIAQLLAGEQTRLRGGTSVVVVASDFPDSTVLALAPLRGRVAVTALWIATDEGRPPPEGLVDTRWEVSYADDWKDRSVLELTA